MGPLLRTGVANWLVKNPKVLLIFVLLYFFSPIDLFPEGLLGPIGYGDDLLVVIATLLLRGWSRREATPEAKQNRRPPTPDVVETEKL